MDIESISAMFTAAVAAGLDRPEVMAILRRAVDDGEISPSEAVRRLQALDPGRSSVRYRFVPAGRVR